MSFVLKNVWLQRTQISSYPIQQKSRLLVASAHSPQSYPVNKPPSTHIPRKLPQPHTCTYNVQIIRATQPQWFRSITVSRNSESLRLTCTFLCPASFWKPLEQLGAAALIEKLYLYRTRAPNTDCAQDSLLSTTTTKEGRLLKRVGWHCLPPPCSDCELCSEWHTTWVPCPVPTCPAKGNNNMIHFYLLYHQWLAIWSPIHSLKQQRSRR